MLKKFLALVLAAMMAMSLTAPASASWSTEYSEAQKMSYYFGEPEYSTPYLSGDGRVTVCYTYKLSSAQKIAALTEALHPVQELQYELENLEHHMDPDFARYEAIYSGLGSLDSYLYEDSETRGALSVIYLEDAYELMTVMKLMPEYESVPEVKRIVDSYLGSTLSGNQLRQGLNVLTSSGYAGPEHDTPIDGMSVQELIAYAHQVIETEEFQALMEPLGEVCRGNTDCYALNCRYDLDELDLLWEQLAETAQAYLPGQVKMLEEMSFTVPFEVYSSLEAWEQATSE